MKLLVFAHTPPPHHGQSYMVQLMLSGFGGDQRVKANRGAPNVHGVRCYHVNARVSKELEDIGDFRVSKLFLLLGYCLQAIWCRFRYGVRTLYYIPAPGKHSALYRDWLVMFLCRPFYRRVILHWHAAGLAKWLETSIQKRARAFTYSRMKNVDMSIVLSKYNRADAEKLYPRSIEVVSNGIPDPCPDFERDVHPRRVARTAARKILASGRPLTSRELENTGGDPQLFKVLYLAHCTREKGLFDSIKGVWTANERLKQAGSPFAIELMVAGNFVNAAEKAEFDRACANADERGRIRYLGFVSADQKANALREADLFCFPTFYQNENQPVNLIEAMAFGLPVVTTRWRSLPELLPPGYRGLVDVAAPEQIADQFITALTTEPPESFRERFLRQFTLEKYLGGLAGAFRRAESTGENAPQMAMGPRPQAPHSHPAG